ncbi:MAG: Stp1/IreP family PP2C-type Ser/Thr phosphatase [Gemmatimonadetes bacterium]|nr:Stp1/IreP family PP2C-type Ser/Thr phosphatase [Gemmatimonadota bacterium]MBT8479205.1 Stp1/IreP family PP2C-type Ser/Thr phosphatase [Gemmatimonadota bacterium]NNK49750.1 Stp1/IreP family PP2C-type Ser/Thr phosphatase [Gemmatimonadota bacterium]
MGRFWWKCAALTDVGRVRRSNEDSVYCSAESGVFVVADGMGGHAAGEVASAIASEWIAERLCGACMTMELEQVEDRFRTAFVEAGREILRQAAENATRLGMGTTATVLLLRQDGQYIMGHIGDSRGYRVRDGVLSQITRDHSWVQEQVDRGMITPEQAKNHPQSNIITRALGTEAYPTPDLYDGTIESGDIFLLASDGLTDMLSDEHMLKILEAEEDPERCVARLVKEANLAGGLDNVSALVARIGEGS